MKRFLLPLLFGWALSASGEIRVGVMPKLTGIDYFNAVEKGARAAGRDLGVTVVYDGPVTNDVSKQSQLVETWIAQKFDAICIAPNDPGAIAPVLRKARARGIKVITFDSDARPSARDLFVNQASAPAIARALVDLLARRVGPAARYVVLTGSLTADNQNIWMAELEKYRARAFPKMVNLSTPKATEEDQALATQVTIDTLKAYPEMQAMVALTSVALPGAAEGLIKAGAARRIYLTGLSTPKSMRPYVTAGVTPEVVLWNPEDLGYLTVQVAAQLVQKKITAKSTEMIAGKLGPKAMADREVLLGPPLIFTAANIGNFDF